jgi:hypothetical protein
MKPCAETVGRRDAADEPTWTYLRRVSAQGFMHLVGFDPPTNERNAFLLIQRRIGLNLQSMMQLH